MRICEGCRDKLRKPTPQSRSFIHTAPADLNIAATAPITTAAPMSETGTWLIDPQDFNSGSTPGDNISGATLSGLLVTNSVVITTNTGADTNVAGTPPVSTRNTATVGNGVMVALVVDSRDKVDRLYAKALALGATDEGPAGPRGDNFYAGYFRDLDGNKLNVFCMS